MGLNDKGIGWNSKGFKSFKSKKPGDPVSPTSNEFQKRVKEFFESIKSEFDFLEYNELDEKYAEIETNNYKIYIERTDEYKILVNIVEKPDFSTDEYLDEQEIEEFQGKSIRFNSYWKEFVAKEILYEVDDYFFDETGNFTTRYFVVRELDIKMSLYNIDLLEKFLDPDIFDAVTNAALNQIEFERDGGEPVRQFSLENARHRNKLYRFIAFISSIFAFLLFLL